MTGKSRPIERRAVAALVLAVLPIGNVDAADVADEDFLKAAIVIRTFDHFADRCRQQGGFTAAQAERIAIWESAHDVASFRARLPELEQSPVRKAHLEQSLRDVLKVLTPSDARGCATAAAITATPQARFANVTPPLQTARKAADDPEPREPARAAAPPVDVPAQANREMLAQVDSFGFDTRLVMGVGGFLATDIHPVVLFRDGQLLKDAKGLTFAGSLADHRRQHADDWTRWRRSDGELQIAGSSDWRKLPFQVTYRQLPDGFRLDGLFRRLGGTGTAGVGGTASFAAWSEYRFWPDGRVRRGGGAGGRSASGDTSVATSHDAPDRTGTYHVEGLMLHLSFEDGSGEHRVLIADPSDPKGSVWLDGYSYARRRE
ncbi:MAG: hypothetical protein U1F52_14175 [Burkholderiales bacterium]